MDIDIRNGELIYSNAMCELIFECIQVLCANCIQLAVWTSVTG